MYVCMYVRVCLSFCLSVDLSVNLSVNLYGCVSVCLTRGFVFRISLSLCPSVVWSDIRMLMSVMTMG